MPRRMRTFPSCKGSSRSGEIRRGVESIPVHSSLDEIDHRKALYPPNLSVEGEFRDDGCATFLAQRQSLATARTCDHSIRRVPSEPVVAAEQPRPRAQRPRATVAVLATLTQLHAETGRR